MINRAINGRAAAPPFPSANTSRLIFASICLLAPSSGVSEATYRACCWRKGLEKPVGPLSFARSHGRAPKSPKNHTIGPDSDGRQIRSKYFLSSATPPGPAVACIGAAWGPKSRDLADSGGFRSCFEKSAVKSPSQTWLRRKMQLWGAFGAI